MARVGTVVALVAAAALLASVSAASLPFKECGSPVISVKSINVNGNIAPGSSIDITAAGVAASSFTDGSFSFSISIFGVTLLTETGDLCSSSLFHLGCPVSAGAVTATGSLSIPSVAPQGQYTLNITAATNAGDQALCVIVQVSVGVEDDAPAIHPHIIQAVNEAKTTWTAGFNSRFAGMTLGQAKQLMGAKTKGKYAFKLPQRAESTLVGLPQNFDARTQWPHCADVIGHIRDQSNCGSCWAFGSTEAFNDRMCIATNGTFQTELSAMDTTSCCNWETGCFSSACDGGNPTAAWQYFVSNGVVSGGDYDENNTGESCWPYFLPECSHHVTSKFPACPSALATAPSCSNTCGDSKYTKGWTADKHFAKTAYSLGSVDQIMSDLFEYGSVTAAFTVYSDFLTYTSGVYQHTTGSELGGHAIKILGWGEENGTPYWLVANSWNEYWGDQGYFKILRGQDECGIEDDVSAGHAL